LVEAANQFEKALARLTTLPNGPESRWKQLDLHANLGAIGFAIHGWGAPETGQSFARAPRVAASDFDNGVALIQQGISAWQATGECIWLPLFEGLEARAEAARAKPTAH
jgi:hypothetical protein